MAMLDPSNQTWVWVVLALINAGLAQGKGRPGALWLLISLLLGPVATLAIVLLPRQLVDPSVDTVGWHPRRFGRLEWIVLGVIVAVILVSFLGVAVSRG